MLGTVYMSHLQCDMSQRAPKSRIFLRHKITSPKHLSVSLPADGFEQSSKASLGGTCTTCHLSRQSHAS